MRQEQRLRPSRPARFAVLALVLSGMHPGASAEGGLPGGLTTVVDTSHPPAAAGAHAPPPSALAANAAVEPGGAIYSPFAAGLDPTPKVPAHAATAPTAATSRPFAGGYGFVMAMVGIAGVAFWGLRSSRAGDGRSRGVRSGR